MNWKPIETAPIGEMLLLFSPTAPNRYDVGIKHVGWHSFGSYGPYVQPTHWMPLPPPPNE